MIKIDIAYRVKTYAERKWILNKMHAEGFVDSYGSSIFDRDYEYYIVNDCGKIIPLCDFGLKFKDDKVINVSDIIDIEMKSVTLDEFVEVCICNGYKSISIDLKTKSVSVLVGENRVEASELGYEVRI